MAYDAIVAASSNKRMKSPIASLLSRCVLLLTTLGANAFLPPYSSVRLPPQRTFPFLSVSKLVKPCTTLLRVATDPVESANKEANVEGEDDDFPMPWSQFQDYCLRDNLSKYVVSLSVDGKEGSKQQLYALWRTMMREVPELSGYDIDFLRDVHFQQLKRDNENATLTETPKVLPMLDDYNFESSGGLSGRVYGIPGVADGTNIVTTSIASILTVSQGYVQTEDGAATYELGTPHRDAYSLDDANTRVQEFSSQALNIASQGLSATPDEDPDTQLVRLGYITAVMLAGATAVDMLSHHLTLEVFWV